MPRPMRVVHCFRAPVGGLFRHVCDLARGQAASGIEVGLICDSSTGGATAIDSLEEISHVCALGVERLPMSRTLSFSDFTAAAALRRRLRTTHADIVHGHGAKGGAYARIASLFSGTSAFYTPHGGSLHYSRRTPVGFVFLGLEQILATRTDGFIFESAFGLSAYSKKIGLPKRPVKVVPNGLAEHEFAPVEAADDATDFLFVGELRHLKGVDVLLHALAKIKMERPVTATIVGSGPDEQAFKSLCDALELNDVVRFAGAHPARQMFSRARMLVVPSRAESFPYIVLEAAAAGLPMVATDVGGIPEIFGEYSSGLVPPGDVDALTTELIGFLDSPDSRRPVTERLKARVAQEFSVEKMVEDVTSFYCARLSRPAGSTSAEQTHPITPAAE